MPRYWVVSANVNGRPATLQPWVRTILLNETAYMGWSTRDRLGKVFCKIQPNDAVLIAFGTMIKHGASRRLVACGRVESNLNKRDPRVADLIHNQFAQLRSFVSLDEAPRQNGISLRATPFDGTNQPSAVFELRRGDPKHLGSSELCDWLDKKLAKSAKRAATKDAPSGRVVVNTVSTGGQENTEGHQLRTKKQVTLAEHREQRLVRDFQRFLRTKKLDPDRRQYKTTESVFYCDLYEPTRKHLIEAKASNTREDVRMAIGQLLDYERLSKAGGLGRSHLAILLPERPSAEIERLLDSVKIAAIWRHGKTFEDNRDRRFL